MAWVRLDDQFPDNKKVVPLTDAAFRLHVSAMCWSMQQLTDGIIPKTIVKKLAWFHDGESNALLTELLTAELWHDIGVSYEIHDYLEYNPSAEEIKRKRKLNAKRQARHRDNHPKEQDNAPSNALRNASVIVSPSPSPIDDDEGDDDTSSSVNGEPDARQQAIDALGRLGIWNSVDLARFDDMWPELAGRTDWVGRAVTIARDNAKGSPIKYALKVLANAIHTNEPPGERRTGNQRKKVERMPDDYEGLKAKYGTPEPSDLPWAKAALANLEH